MRKRFGHTTNNVSSSENKAEHGASHYRKTGKEEHGGGLSVVFRLMDGTELNKNEMSKKDLGRKPKRLGLR